MAQWTITAIHRGNRSEEFARTIQNHFSQRIGAGLFLPYQVSNKLITVPAFGKKRSNL